MKGFMPKNGMIVIEKEAGRRERGKKNLPCSTLSRSQWNEKTIASHSILYAVLYQNNGIKRSA